MIDSLSCSFVSLDHVIFFFCVRIRLFFVVFSHVLCLVEQSLEWQYAWIIWGLWPIFLNNECLWATHTSFLLFVFTQGQVSSSIDEAPGHCVWRDVSDLYVCISDHFPPLPFYFHSFSFLVILCICTFPTILAPCFSILATLKHFIRHLIHPHFLYQLTGMEIKDCKLLYSAFSWGTQKILPHQRHSSFSKWKGSREREKKRASQREAGNKRFSKEN